MQEKMAREMRAIFCGGCLTMTYFASGRRFAA
jgi:hypothetical protein